MKYEKNTSEKLTSMRFLINLECSVNGVVSGEPFFGFKFNFHKQVLKNILTLYISHLWRIM